MSSKKQNNILAIILSLPKNARQAYYAADLAHQTTHKKDLQFVDILACADIGEKSLRKGLNELQAESLLSYTAARWGNPAKYRLSHSVVNFTNPVVQQQTDLLKNQCKGDKIDHAGPAKNHDATPYSAANMTDIMSICELFKLTEGFVLGIVSERMTRYNEDAHTAITLLRRRCMYASQRETRNYQGYVRTIYLMEDFNEPEARSARSAGTTTPDRPGDRPGRDNSQLGEWRDHPADLRVVIKDSGMTAESWAATWALTNCYDEEQTAMLIKMAVAAMPEAAPEAAPEPTPEPTPEAAPETTPEAAPETTPEATPEAEAEAVPETTPKAVPETTPEAKQCRAGATLLTPGVAPKPTTPTPNSQTLQNRLNSLVTGIGGGPVYTDYRGVSTRIRDVDKQKTIILRDLHHEMPI